MAPQLLAVVCRYWKERDENLPQIISDLRAGALPPDEILVWDQGPQPGPDLDATVIRSPKNFQTRARLIAALLYDAEHYLFVDDDITVGHNTAKELIARLDRAHVVCVRGVGYSGERISSANIDEDTPVRWMIGRLFATDRQALARFVQDETDLGTFTYCEDALLGSHGAFCVAGAQWRDLDDHSVGLNYADWYEERRDRMLERIP